MVQQLDLPGERVNPNGSGISLGHPIGATGAIITVKALHELNRINGRYALVSLCTPVARREYIWKILLTNTFDIKIHINRF